jgi:hypothetical protein
MENKRLVVIEWFDSVIHENHWRYMSNLPELGIGICISVGWIASEDAELIMLVSNMGFTKDGEPDQASGFIQIPKCSIKRYINLADPIYPEIK